MKKLRVIHMPETDVRLIVPGDVELFCMASYKKDGESELECCKISDKNPVEYSFPMLALIDGLEKLGEEGRIAAACFVIKEVAKAAGLEIMEVKGSFDHESFAKELQDISNGGNEE